MSSPVVADLSADLFADLSTDRIGPDVTSAL
jgi:hypothetical protein